MERVSNWIAALSICAMAGTAPAQQADVACNATNARLNLNRDLKSGTDFVPILADDSLGFHVSYSVKSDSSFTVGIFILPLDNNEVLIFGAGYADNSMQGKEAEAAAVDATLRECMGYSPEMSTIHLVAPHGHQDHINPSLVQEMMDLGYSFAEIVYHKGDAVWIDQMDWTPDQRSLFNEIDGSICGSNLIQFASPLGRIWFTSRPGHTEGAMDLILDIENDATNRLLIRGSVAGGKCPPIPGVALSLDAHGTVFLPPEDVDFRARAEVVNGVGINRLCLLTDSAPRVGGSWNTMIDAQGHVDAYGLVLIGYTAALSPGLQIPYGELLLDTRGGTFLMCLSQPTSTPTFILNVPADPNYLGFEAWFQGLILGGTTELCNGLHVQIGA